jgi:hypothetical protein
LGAKNLNRKVKYISINISIFFIMSVIIFFFSRLTFSEKGILIIIFLGINIITLLFSIFVNYIWFKILTMKYSKKLNYSILLPPIVGSIFFIFTNYKFIMENIEAIIIFLPMSTWFLLSLYIRNNILE